MQPNFFWEKNLLNGEFNFLQLFGFYVGGKTGTETCNSLHLSNYVLGQNLLK